MTSLHRHLTSITSSSQSLASLPFPPPSIFTNALLTPHDITALIRDTEPHERALFSVPAPLPSSTAQSTQTTTNPGTSSVELQTRRKTVFEVAKGEVSTGDGGAGGVGRREQRRTAVSSILGKGLSKEIRKTTAEGEVDVEVLLRGAEKLCEVHRSRDAEERILMLRKRWGRVRGVIEGLEGRVERQRRELEGLRGWEREEEGMGEGDGEGEEGEGEKEVGEEELWAVEEEVRELERVRGVLEARVRGMERDLGGLLR